MIGAISRERHGEHVVQDEREPLLGRERVEDDEQREADGVGHQRLALGLRGRAAGAVAGRLHDRLRQPRADVLLAARAAGAQHVQRDARDDGRQPAAEVVDGVVVAAAQAQPGLLDGVLGLRRRAEHPVGHGAQPRAVVLELVGELVVVHHKGDGWRARNVTVRPRALVGEG